MSQTKDSKQVLQSFKDAGWEESYSWLTLDVVSLYSNIPHPVAVTAIEYMLKKYSAYSVDTCHFVVLAVEFLLTHNFFSFNDKFFLQTKGAPMGSKFSPSLANLVMSFWEEKYIYSDHNPYHSLYNMPMIIIWV